MGDTAGFVDREIYSLAEVAEIYDALFPEERIFNFPHDGSWMQAEEGSVDPFETRNKYGDFANPQKIEINRRPNSRNGSFEGIVRDLLIWVKEEGEGLGHYLYQEAVPEQDLRKPAQGPIYVKGGDLNPKSNPSVVSPRVVGASSKPGDPSRSSGAYSLNNDGDLIEED